MIHLLDEVLRQVIDFAKSWNDVTTFLADLAALIIAAVAVAATMPYLARRRVRGIVRREFRRAVSDSLRKADGSDRNYLVRWIKTRITIRNRAKAVISGDLNSTAEFEWLINTLRASRGSDPSTAFLLRQPGADGMCTAATCESLRASYVEYSKRLDRRLIFGSRTSPVLASEAGNARGVAQLLGINLDGLPRGLTEQAAFKRADGDLRMFLLDAVGPEPNVSEPDDGVAPPGSVGIYHACDSLVTYVRDGSNSNQLAGRRDIGADEFDGVLPWIRGVRLEKSSSSGRHRVHFSCGERRWSEFQAINRLRANDQQFAASDGLLTLSLAAVDSAGYLILTRRGQLRGNPNAVNSFVTGNLEIQPRHGVERDLDSLGSPDLAQAVVREAQEETGQTIPHEDVHLIGLQRVWTSTDRGTWIATFGVTLATSAREIASNIRHADPIEGSPEVGPDLYAVKIPTSERKLGVLLASLLLPVGDERVTPHAAAAVLSVACLRGHRLASLARSAELSRPKSLRGQWRVYSARAPLGE